MAVMEEQASSLPADSPAAPRRRTAACLSPSLEGEAPAGPWNTHTTLQHEPPTRAACPAFSPSEVRPCRGLELGLRETRQCEGTMQSRNNYRKNGTDSCRGATFLSPRSPLLSSPCPLIPLSEQAGASLLRDQVRQRSQLQVLLKSLAIIIIIIIPQKLHPQLPPRVFTTIKLNGKLRQ